MHFSNTLLAFLGATLTLAAPTDHRLEDIQCRCLSFSTDAKPTPCTYMESQRLGWTAAYSFASDYNLKIEFASPDTVSNILAMHRPLPTSVLQAVSGADAVPAHSEDLMHRSNKIICGFDQEVKNLGSHDRSMEPECRFVSYVIVALMVAIALYVLAEYAYSRFAQGTIKLDGDEQVLTATPTASQTARDECEEKIATADLR
ncbi:hypothetical protein ACEQ8H_003731 [Pleosporales sp. CAS-2024a]